MTTDEIYLSVRQGSDFYVIDKQSHDRRALVSRACHFMKPRCEPRLNATAIPSYFSSQVWRNSEAFSRLVASDSIGTGARSRQDPV